MIQFENQFHFKEAYFKASVILGPTNAPASGMFLTVAGSIGPEADATRNLGSSTLRFNDAVITRGLFGVGASASGSGSVSISRSDGQPTLFHESAANNQFIMPYDYSAKARGSLGSLSTATTGDWIKLRDATVYDGTAYRIGVREIDYVAIRTGSDNIGVGHQWQTRPRGSGGTLAIRLDLTDQGSLIHGDQAAALATTATDGFIYIRNCAGAPTGAATAVTGSNPVIIDTTNLRIYVYIAGTWRFAQLT